MGGDIDVPGNATPAAEMNWFYDPDAIKICLAANWKSQIVVPDDLARHIKLTEEFYERLAKKESNSITKLILSQQKTFENDSANYVWDIVVSAIFLRPELITDIQTRYITVDNTPGINSGRTVTWTQNDHNDMKNGIGFPEGVNAAQIVMQINSTAFWDFYIDLLAMK